MKLKQSIAVLCAGLFMSTGIAACAQETAPQSPTSASDNSAPTNDDNGTVNSGKDSISSLIDEGLKQVTSDFQREILQKAKDTGEILEADWKEANNRYVVCMAEGGVELKVEYQETQVQFVEEGGNASAVSSQEERMAEVEKRQPLSQKCDFETNLFVNSVYSALNGTNQVGDYPIEKAVYSCLIDQGILPQETTFEQFLADLQSNQNNDTPEEQRQCWIDNS